jgi:hypothetical protein
MAHIHRISGSTQYLIKGVQPIQGKKLTTLDEIQHFYNHYEEILAESRQTVERQQDEIILGLNNDENDLARQLQNAIKQRTDVVDKEINELMQKITIEKGFFLRIGYRLRHWYVVAFRERHIHGPCRSISRNLHTVRDRKYHHIATKGSVIQRECYSVTRSYEFLKANESFLIGAQGEEVVISALARLPDDFHVLNDVNLHFHKAIHWRERDEYIKNCQIDHIVAGPTGVFLLETKNWKSSDIELKSDKLKYQVRRASLALWYFTKDYYFGKKDQPKVFSVIISLNESNTGHKLGQYIDIISPYQIHHYIMHRDKILSEGDVDKFVKIISRTY